ncbi:MAG: hypothetical protein L6R43_17435 [Planctomycetes bacterium]|nr:hypothetical protein [Planctomycetota bacterium]
MKILLVASAGLLAALCLAPAAPALEEPKPEAPPAGEGAPKAEDPPPAPEKPAPEKPAEEKPAPEKPAAEKPPERKVPKEPSRPVAERIHGSLKALFTGSGAARMAAQSALEGAVAEWAAEAKDDPLKATEWWRTALAGTFNAGARKAGISEVRIPLEGKEARFWVSVPKSYNPKNLHPLLLVILDREEDPKRWLGGTYGDLLKDWLVVAVSTDSKAAGIDIPREPWLAALGLRHAIEEYRVDLDRVVLDAGPGSANLAANLGAEWAVHFSGVVLRGPSLVSPLATNLLLCGTLAAMPDNPNPAQKGALEALQKSVPGAAVIPATAHAEVQKWIAALPPRRITNPGTLSFSWKTRPQGGEPWAYWFWVFRAADAKKDRFVDLTFTRTDRGGSVAITGDNLAEGILLLNDDLLDLDREVAVTVNGTEVWKGVPRRQVRTALYWIGQSGERTLFAPTEIRFTVPTAAAAAPKPAGGG